jgi:hypothetical protein
MRRRAWSALLIPLIVLAAASMPSTISPRSPRASSSGAVAVARSAPSFLLPGPSPASSTAVPPWPCIRYNESRGIYTEPGGGAYQFQGVMLKTATHLTLPGEDYSPRVQDWAALKVYALAMKIWGNGWQPWKADWAVCGLG